MPPLLRVQPGDTVRLTVQNGGSLPTNVHYHGLNVSPLGASDNVFIEIDPATTFQYDMPIPSDHPVGLFWYHPHFHPRVNTEIAGGLSGSRGSSSRSRIRSSSASSSTTVTSSSTPIRA